MTVECRHRKGTEIKGEEREKGREKVGKKKSQAELNCQLLSPKKKWTGVLAAPLRNRQGRRRKRGIGGEDDRGRPRRGECGK